MNEEKNIQTAGQGETVQTAGTQPEAPAPRPVETAALGTQSVPAVETIPIVKRGPVFTRKEAWQILPAAGAAALLYAFCFSGVPMRPQISFTLFCAVIFAILTFTLKKLGRFKNTRAYLWAAPIAVLALCNGLFDANFFTWGNVMAMHMLFAAYTITAVRAQPADIFNLNGALTLTRLILGQWTAFISAFAGILGSRSKPGFKRFTRVLLGAVLALPVLLVVTALLSSADAAFRQLTHDLLDTVFAVEWLDAPFIFSFILVWIYAIGYMALSDRLSRPRVRGGSPADTMSESRPVYGYVDFPLIKADATVCATFLILVNALFLAFTLVQVLFLFNGGFMTLPMGVAYAEYAREGFFQLLFVTFVNFTVIIIFMTILSGVRENKWLRGLMLALCGFTGVLIASSFYRMGLYTQAYGHTTLRLCVYTFLVMEIVLLLVTVWKLFSVRLHFIRWFVLTGLVFYMIANFTGSEYLAAKLNSRLFLSGRLEYIDIGPMGMDGLRVLRPLLENDKYVYEDRRLVRKSTYRGAVDEDSYYKWNDNDMRIDHWQNWSFFKRQIS